jgi:MoaA/NifB/PqqE/SkfB family radical SAM enzyme
MNKFPENLCLAPFAFLTFDPANNVSPCPALGGSVWSFPQQPITNVWMNSSLVDFRQHMLDNQRHEICHRCWSEEAVAMPSQRMRLWDMRKDPTGVDTPILGTSVTPSQVLNSESYKKGPMQLAIKVSNVCNLRCRSCNSADSVTLAVEGRFYEERHGMTNNFWLKETETKTFTDQQIDDIVALCDNVVRIEFYGGEPLLDHQLPQLLKKLVDRGLASGIQLNISTNITHRISPELIDILAQFQHLNLNLSIDGWAEKFTYLRHPANWHKVYNNIKWFIELRDSNQINMSLLPVATVTIMNVFDLPELITKLQQEFNLSVFLILAWFPFYYSIRNIPDDLSDCIATHLEKYQLNELVPIINALREPAELEHWEMFKKWNRMVDDYRAESFIDTFPKYAELIQQYDTTFYQDMT